MTHDLAGSAPIALFVYARPEHTRRLLASLLDNPPASKSDLIVFSDAAKKPEHEASVAEVRALIREIRGFRSVELIERSRNLGLKASIADGVTQVCERFGKVIVLEDDLVVAPLFLEFMNAALDRYADVDAIQQISGYMYPGNFGAADDVLLLPMVSCWGWATWKRAWDNYDPSLSGFDELDHNVELKERFNLNGAYDYYGMAKQQKEGRLDSWGICWHLSVFLRGGLVAYPARSLVRNLGTDGSGTHGAGHGVLQAPLRAVDAWRVPHWPTQIETHQSALAQVERLLRGMQPSGLMPRLKSWLRR